MNRFSRILHHTDINDIKQKNSDRITVLKLTESKNKRELLERQKELQEISNPNFSDWRTDLEEGMTTKGTFQTVLGGQGEENLSDYDATTDIDQWGDVPSYENGISPESTVGVNIGPAGTGSGDDGGFNIEGGYLNFNDTKSQIIIPKIDLTVYDEIVVTAIRGNGSNGGIDPTAKLGDLELIWATPRSNINDGTPSYLYPNMNENGINQATGLSFNEYHQKYNQFIPSNHPDWNTYNAADTGLREWALPVPEWMRFDDVALIIGKYNAAFNPGTYGITKVAFRRVKPITLFVSLDSPEATSFVRVGGGSSPSTPKKRKKKVEDQLQASKEYTDKVLGKEFPGSGTVLDPKPAETTPTRNYDDLAKDYKAAGSLDDQLTRFLSGGLSRSDVQAQAEPQADAEPVSDSQAPSFSTTSKGSVTIDGGKNGTGAIKGADIDAPDNPPKPTEQLPPGREWELIPADPASEAPAMWTQVDSEGKENIEKENQKVEKEIEKENQSLKQDVAKANQLPDEQQSKGYLERIGEKLKGWYDGATEKLSEWYLANFADGGTGVYDVAGYNNIIDATNMLASNVTSILDVVLNTIGNQVFGRLIAASFNVPFEDLKEELGTLRSSIGKASNNLSIARSIFSGKVTHHVPNATEFRNFAENITVDMFQGKGEPYSGGAKIAISDTRHEYVDDNIYVDNGIVYNNRDGIRSVRANQSYPSLSNHGKGYAQFIIPKDGGTPYLHYYDHNYHNLQSTDNFEVTPLPVKIGGKTVNVSLQQMASDFTHLASLMAKSPLGGGLKRAMNMANQNFIDSFKSLPNADSFMGGGWPKGIHGSALTDFKLPYTSLSQEVQDYINSHPLYYDGRVDRMSEDELNAEGSRLYVDTYKQDAQASERVSEEAIKVADEQFPEINQWMENNEKEREKFEEAKKVHRKELSDALTTRVDLAKFQKWNSDFEGTLNDYLRGTKDKAWARRYASLSGVDLGEVDKLMKDYDLGARNKFFVDGKIKEGVDSDYTWARSQPEYKEAEAALNDAKKATEAAYEPYIKALDVAAAFERSLPRHPTKKGYVTGTHDQIAKLRRLGAEVNKLKPAYDKAYAEEQKYIYEPGNISYKLVKERRAADNKVKKISVDAYDSMKDLYDEAGVEVDRLNALAKEKFEPEPLDDKIIDAYRRGFMKIYNRLWFERDGLSADSWNPGDAPAQGQNTSEPFVPDTPPPPTVGDFDPYADVDGSQVAQGKTEYGKTDYGLKKDGSLGMPDDNWGKDVGDEDDVLDLLGGKRAKRKRGSGYSIDEPIVSTAKKKKKRNTMAASYKPQGGTLKETTFDRIKKVRKKFDYEGKPTPTDDGYPENPPAELGKDGFHSEYGKNSNRYKKLDPISAKAMARVKTGDPETDALVRKQAKKPK
jgi:hypothetical protein